MIHRTAAHNSSGNQRMSSCHDLVPDGCRKDDEDALSDGNADEDDGHGDHVPEENSLCSILVWLLGSHS